MLRVLLLMLLLSGAMSLVGSFLVLVKDCLGRIHVVSAGALLAVIIFTIVVLLLLNNRLSLFLFLLIVVAVITARLLVLIDDTEGCCCSNLLRGRLLQSVVIARVLKLLILRGI